MARVIAVANQKGGVGKTTTVHTLGTALAEAGQRVLLVDLDPQACLTYSVGLDPESLPLSLHDVLVGRNKAVEAMVARRRAVRRARGDRSRGLRGAPRRPGRDASTRSGARSSR